MKYSFVSDNLISMSESLSAFSSQLKSQGVREDAIFFSRLAGCELMTNALRHGGAEAAFEGEILADRIRITVTSADGSFAISATLPDLLSESGRGLYIVKSVCIGEIERNGKALTVYIKK
ncbi:MAG: ATP-binding protein [Clostridiales bacterium]|nr:ATP-binding protein [Clostridiales bacterium]